jgi:catechol 2,3-dioxygenase-like lactoylglutathione lyase family enzyme
MLFDTLNPVQLAYHVSNPEAAAREYSRIFGWGPFFLMEHIELSSCVYRGTAAKFDHTSAYGQAGDIMVELITQHDDSPSVLRELYAREAVGIHHVAHFVPDLNETLREAQAAGVAVALDASTSTGTRFAMLDTTRALGHMVEIYEPAGDLLKFYRHVRRAAEGWNGEQPVRHLKPRT